MRPRRGPFTAYSPPELFRYRDLLFSFVRRDLTLRYRQTLLGPAWVLLQPLLSAGVFTFIFGSVATVALPPHVSYFVFALTGMALWTGFSQTMTRTTSVMLSNTPLVTKTYFPRFLLPASTALASLVDCIVMLLVALFVALATGTPLLLSALLVLLIAALLVAFALTVSAALSVMLVRFRDVAYGLPIIIQALLFVTPILYPLSSVPHHLRPFVELNPLTFVFESLRACTFGTPRPGWGLAAYSISCMTGLAVASLALFSKLERNVTDVI